ncbi:GNAT family N-acetyltransferase [Nocardiopsis potens]|uniref:GNAT family N-acetyltransferase n=1 Tax=Nocardiopsis potens TaxID=1246458 RepID=UPI000347CAF9|nr:GNAT family N-acetyltransferase [Nocardiopsis potens]
MELTHWPLYGLRLCTPRLELRLPDLAELDALAGTAARGVHEPGSMPFAFPWTDCPPAERGRRVMAHFWKLLGEWDPQRWRLPLVVFAGGAPIGIQEIAAEDFGLVRDFDTGSWLGLEHHGRGYGTEMRAAVLHLGFAELGAETARSAAMSDNPASLAVSRKLGYRTNGTGRLAVDGRRRGEVRLLLERADWERHRTVPVRAEGVSRCLDMFGADAAEDGPGESGPGEDGSGEGTKNSAVSAS